MRYTFCNIIRWVTVLGTLFASNAYAQIEMGGWKTAFSYNGISQVIQTKNKVFAVSNGSLFSVDKQGSSIETYSKINGLSDGDITLASYNTDNDMMLICYSNLNIDIVDGGAIYNISDLKRKDISSKTINNIAFKGGTAYLSCGFGIVAINMAKKEIANTYIIGSNGQYVSVDQVQTSADSIYALTPSALYSASLSDPNLQNYAHWVKMNLPNNTYTKQTLAYFNNKLNLFRNSWYQKNGNEWNLFSSDIVNVSQAHVNGDFLTLQSSNNLTAVYDKDYQSQTLQYNKGYDASYDPASNHLWIGCDSLEEFSMGQATRINVFCPEGPGWNDVSFIKYQYGKLFSGYGPDFSASGIIQIYENNAWSIIRREDLGTNYNANNAFRAIWDATVDPKDTKRMFVATWRSLFEFYDNKLVNKYYSTNTKLDAWSSDTSLILLDGVMIDKNNVLWVLNVQSGNLLKARDANGTWHSLSYSDLDNKATATNLFQSENGFKWMLFPRLGVGVYVINDNNTPFYTGDDKTEWLSTFTLSDGSTVTPSTYKSIAEDKNHDIWIGTDVGPIILKNTANIFNSGYTATRIKITREDNSSLADYLLSTEQINAIAVDGANRKWIGTAASGVYLISDDGQKTIHHFTTDNSPLTTNTINGIAINTDNGEVYIATPNGMFIYQGDAAEGKENLNDVHVYPNPVRPEFDGLITISGLMENTEVRITDTEGHVLVHGLSNGSLYTWDGQLNNGSHAPSGIYFVFEATQDGNYKNVAKFAIVKK